MLATWKRVPFAVTERCVHGPLIWMTGSAGMLRPLPLRRAGGISAVVPVAAA